MGRGDAALLTARKAALDAHPLKDKPDSECEECHGTGTYKSTYNPKSQWDWWRVGGRWDGHIQQSPRENGFNFGDQHRQLQYNVARAADLPADFSCFAMVTPDGERHEKGDMGWFSMVRDKKKRQDWIVEIRRLLGAHSDCLAVGCDLHI